jgi:hypothetical protein
MKMLKYVFSLALLVMVGCGQAEDLQPPYKWRSATQEESSPADPSGIDGYPVANFALTANVSADGSLYGHIMQNPGQLGDWLANRGAVTLLVEKSGQKHAFSGFKKKTVQRAFPFVKNTYEQSPLTPVTFQLTTFCPLAVNDAVASSLPALLLELTCVNATPNAESFTVVVAPETLMAGGVQVVDAEHYSGVAGERYQISCNSATQWASDALHIPVALNAHEEKTLHIALSFYDDRWISANQFANVGELADFVHKVWPVLKEKTVLFDAAIPQTGDAELDEYLRWYLIPGISLTKYTKNGELLTMGYRELNQRDSYWTSWLHLVLFKEAERTMIAESMAWQQPSGKIPTTILPLIEREDDLDINAFFILRVARFYQYYADSDWLAACWPAMKKAMNWLISRDSNGDGLPVQVSPWGDWKDVEGVRDRKYSPFSGLLYLAALKQMVFLSRKIGDNASVATYQAAYQKGSVFINRTVSDGGLWNGNYYCQRLHNGTVNNRLLQDQMIGVLFGVVSQERAGAIVRSLNEKSLTAYGIAETTPYYPDSWGFAAGTYHNGGVWPWLSFMDCWARIRMGRTEEAIALIKKVAHADLVASGDWSPNEHINSLTGENLGYQLQGWNAGLFGLVYFGLLHQGIIP